MPVYEFNGKKPVIGPGTWVAPSAEIIGNVSIGRNCYIGFGAIIRADFGEIAIGNETAVEEAVVIHEGLKVDIGHRVIIGHMAMIHDATIEDCVLIGMQTMICDYAVIKEWSIIAEQSMVRKNQVVPSAKIYRGSPAREAGDLQEKHRKRLIEGSKIYVDLAKQYHDTFKRID
ncbi:MAG: gamma carbonic anhydrase family protein [Proteobacteria bacterium]|nr:gamma carbonic anhydrase family protein [Pseudomonadota bacterium]